MSETALIYDTASFVTSLAAGCTLEVAKAGVRRLRNFLKGTGLVLPLPIEDSFKKIENGELTDKNESEELARQIHELLSKQSESAARIELFLEFLKDEKEKAACIAWRAAIPYDLPPKPTPGRGLRRIQDYHYQYCTIPFVGRDVEMATMEAFVECDDKFLWTCIYGAAGSGKSRFAFEMCHIFKERGWDCGFMENMAKIPMDDWRKWEPVEDTLLVVDYAGFHVGRDGSADDPNNLDNVFSELYARTRTWKKRVRFVLLERDKKSEIDAARPRLLAEKIASGIDTTQVNCAKCKRTTIDHLPAMSDRDLYGIAKKVVEENEDEWRWGKEQDFARLMDQFDKERRPLYAIIIALAYKGKDGQLSREDMLEGIFKREYDKFWERHGFSREDAYLLAMATICGGLNTFPDGLETLVTNVWDDDDDTNCKRFEAIGYVPDGGKETQLHPMEPDLLGEFFVLAMLSSWEGLGKLADHRPRSSTKRNDNASKILKSAWMYSLQNTAAFFRRCSQDFPHRNIDEYFLRITPSDDFEKSEWARIATNLVVNLCKSGNFTSAHAIYAGMAMLGDMPESVQMRALASFYLIVHYLADDDSKTARAIFNSMAVNEKDYLMGFAATMGLIEAMMWLKDQGADINAKSSGGRTPIFWAVAAGQTDAMAWLKKQGADVNAKDNDGRTPIFWAAAAGQIDAMVWLKRQGTDVSAKNNDGGTPMFSAAQNDQINAMAWLKAQGADINAKSIDGRTPMFEAASLGRVEAMAWLKDQGADVNARADKGGTSMIAAAMKGQIDAMIWLKKQGVSINVEDNNGKTPMFGAAFFGQIEAMAWLKDQGADINAKANSGSTPMFMAAWQGQIDAMKWLKEQGVDVNTKDNGGSTVIFAAAAEGQIDVMAWLMEQGADINAKDNDGRTPMFLVAILGQLAVARYLKEHGADVHAKDNNGWTPMHGASMNGHIEVMAWLKPSNSRPKDSTKARKADIRPCP